MSKQDNLCMKRKQTLFRLLAKALGEKASKNDREADNIAHIRIFIFLTYLITNCFIIAGVIRHWNSQQTIIIEQDVSSVLSETKKERLLQTSRNITHD